MWVCFALVAWAAALLACGRLCLAGSAVARQPVPGAAPAPEAGRLSLYEAAFLAGGPVRVVDVTLVALALDRRLLLAHTGWATVVDPEGRDPVERAVIAAVGEEGQRPVRDVRAAALAAARGSGALRELDDRLTRAGLAVPARIRESVDGAVRHVKAAGLLVLATGAVAVALQPAAAQRPVAGWFVLPLILIAGCLAIARVEADECTHWATVHGQARLAAQDDGGSPLTALAVRGPDALADPELRSALTAGAT